MFDLVSAGFVLELLLLGLVICVYDVHKVLGNTVPLADLDQHAEEVPEDEFRLILSEKSV